MKESTMSRGANGILFVDKAEGWTSHDVVAKARRSLGTRKVGHAGTLDPMATGLLTLGAGASTRLLTHLVGLDKTYTTTIRLGQSTVTDDREGDVLDTVEPAALRAVTDSDIAREVGALTGAIEQEPSRVSAIKVDGKRAYDRVRSGEDVKLRARPVTIYAFEVGETRRSTLDNGTEVTDIDATVRCSSGTYVRALARDLGASLGVGGHLTALRRTAVGPFQLPDHPTAADAMPGTDPAHQPTPVQALTTEQLADGQGLDLLADPAAVAAAILPTLQLTEQQTIDLGHGKKLSVGAGDTELIAAIAPTGRLIGLVSVAQGTTRVITNFPTESQEG